MAQSPPGTAIETSLAELERLRQENARLRVLLEGGETVGLPRSPELQILDNMPHAVFWKDQGLHYLGGNQRFLDAVGMTAAELVGKTDFDLPWKERAAFYRQLDQRVLEFERPEFMTERQLPFLNNPEGRGDTWNRVTKAPIRDGDGKVVGVLGVVEDITEQHRMEEAIRSLVQMTFTNAGEDTFRVLARHLAQALETRYAVVGELAPGAPGRLRALALWDRERGFLDGVEYPLDGYPCGEVVGRQFCEFSDGLLDRFPDADLLRPLEVESYLGAPLFDSQGKALGQMAVLDTRSLHASATTRQILEMFSVRAAAEMERKRIDQELRNAQAMLERRVEERTSDLAAAHESLRSLLYIVSHDLRAPLVNLKGFAGELQSASEEIQRVVDPGAAWLADKDKESLDRALQEDIPEALGFIDTSINRIDHFMNTLLRLSAEGRRELHMELLNVNQLVEEMLKILAYQVEKNRAVVTVGRLPEVVADQISLEQILSNLLSNAVLYLDPERPGRIEVTGERTEEHVVFRIRDNGRGITQEDQAKLFLPFRRGRYTDVEGEGMGLAYVEALVRRHGGRIECTSEVDVGTTFTFTISTELMENDPRTGVFLLAPIQAMLAKKEG